MDRAGAVVWQLGRPARSACGRRAPPRRPSRPVGSRRARMSHRVRAAPRPARRAPRRPATSRSASTRRWRWSLPDEPDVLRLLDDLARPAARRAADAAATHRALAAACDAGRPARRARAAAPTASPTVARRGRRRDRPREAARLLRARRVPTLVAGRTGPRSPSCSTDGEPRRADVDAAPCATAGRTWWSRPRRRLHDRAVRRARRDRLPALRRRPPRPARPAPGAGARAGRRPAGRYRPDARA